MILNDFLSHVVEPVILRAT